MLLLFSISVPAKSHYIYVTVDKLLILLYKNVKSFLSFPNPYLSQFKVEGPYYFHNVVLQESLINYVMQL